MQKKKKKKKINDKKKKIKKKKKQEWSQLDFVWINFGFKFDKAAQVTTVSSIWCSIVTVITPFSIRKNLFYLWPFQHES